MTDTGKVPPRLASQALHAATVRSQRSPRWDLLGRYRVEVDSRLMLDRLRIVQCPWFALLLTRIREADKVRDPHNHSRPFLTLILQGSYTERVWADTRDMRRSRVRGHRRFSMMFMPQASAHQIIQTTGRPLTLVLAGRHHDTWSFWTAQGPVDWRGYG
jgi:hypothetical protein